MKVIVSFLVSKSPEKRENPCNSATSISTMGSKVQMIGFLTDFRRGSDWKGQTLIALRHMAISAYSRPMQLACRGFLPTLPIQSLSPFELSITSLYASSTSPLPTLCSSQTFPIFYSSLSPYPSRKFPASLLLSRGRCGGGAARRRGPSRRRRDGRGKLSPKAENWDASIKACGCRPLPT